MEWVISNFVMLIILGLIILALAAFFFVMWGAGVIPVATTGLGALLVVLALLGLSGASTLSTPQVVVTSTPVVVTATPEPATEPTPTAVARSEPSGICRNTPGNEQGGSRTLVVEEGHLLNVEWYGDGWATHVRSILPPGTYNPKAGIKIGAWWDYVNCTDEYVQNQSGSDHDWTEGFTRS